MQPAGRQQSHIYMDHAGIYANVMLGAALYCLLLCTCALLVWRAIYARQSRQRASEVLEWIEVLLYGQGHPLGIKWEGASRFQVPLRLRSHTFRNASLRVHLAPRNLPFSWIYRKLHSRPETLIFEADLDLAPPFTLELQSYRLFARTRKDLAPEAPGWNFEQATPFILTTRKDWQREITSVISSLLSCPERQFLSIAFRQHSPHFSAILALETISPECSSRTEIFDSLRELATGASAPQV